VRRLSVDACGARDARGARVSSALLTLLGGGCGHVFGPTGGEGSSGLAEAAPEAVEAVPSAGDFVAQESETVLLGSAPRAQMQKLGGRPTRRLAQSAGPTPADPAERIVINGTVAVRTIDVSQLVLEVRAHAAEVGGTVVGEFLQGNAEEGHATMRLRLPPPQAVPFADWLATRATLESRQLDSSDVSRTYFDQDLAIKNLQITMGRLQELARRPDAPLKDILEAERELTRVRGDLERLEGQHRLLDDQIARATLAVEILPRRGAHPPPMHVEPELKFELVPRFVTTRFLDDRGRSPNRRGGGVTLMFARSFSLDFVALPRNGAEARSFLLDAVVGGYSDYLGGGRRRFFNPFLAMRLGGGLLEGSGAFSFGADAGVEIVHYEHFLVELAARGQWFVYHKSQPYDVVLSGTVGVGVPF
jgi:hypothetical protein